MPTPTPTSLDWDTFFRVWAVAGPLLAAGVSAWWARRNQVYDRDYEHKLELNRLDRADAARNLDHKRAVQAERYNEIKSAIATFMSSSHEFVRKQSDYWTDPTPEKHQAATLANDKFTYSQQTVILLGDEALAGKAIDLWNATLEIPKSYKTPADAEYEGKIAVYRMARMEFNENARTYLSSLEIQPAI